mgnify:CR=1 FL=1
MDWQIGMQSKLFSYLEVYLYAVTKFFRGKMQTLPMHSHEKAFKSSMNLFANSDCLYNQFNATLIYWIW